MRNLNKLLTTYRKQSMIKWNKKFEYPKTIREAIEGQRHYIINDEKLPSVTTILQATQSEEKKKSAICREKVVT